MNVLLTHISYHCSVGLVKQLHNIKDDKIYIVGTSHYRKGLCSGSMLVDKYYKISNTDYSYNYLCEIINIIENEKIDIIFTSDENEMILFNKNRTKLKTKIIPFASSDIIQLFMNKELATTKIKLLGIQVPKIIEDIKENNKYVSKKVIVRENISCCSYGIKILENSYNIFSYKTDNNFIQEFIDGDEYTVDILCDKNGYIKLIIPRLRIAIRGGITYKCQIIHNEQLIDTCKKIYQNYKIPGFSNVQFIVNSSGIYFIELNPRIGGTTIASSLCSINFAKFIIDECNKKSTKSYDEYMKMVKWNAIITRYYEEVIYEE